MMNITDEFLCKNDKNFLHDGSILQQMSFRIEKNSNCDKFFYLKKYLIEKEFSIYKDRLVYSCYLIIIILKCIMTQ